MPDVQIEANADTLQARRGFSRYVVGIDQLIHYVFYNDSGADLGYSKSLDGGETWSAQVEIHAGSVLKYSIWYDRWTPLDTGTTIHIVLLDGQGGLNSLSYYSLDTEDDTLSAELEIDTPVVLGNNYNSNNISLAKARGGNLLLQYWGTLAGSHGCWRSVDGGASWVARTDAALDPLIVDYIMMFPGNEADNQDMWLIATDRGAGNELNLLVYDDSGDSWSAPASIAAFFISGIAWQFAGAIRHSDGHLLLAMCNQTDTVTMDIQTFDINGAASIIAMGDVATNLPESGNACLTINQQNDDVFVGYNVGGTWASNVDSVYKVSNDGMASWNAEEAMSEDSADDYQALASTLSISYAGGKFLPVWVNDDLDDLLCNVNNAVEIAARRIFVVS